VWREEEEGPEGPEGRMKGREPRRVVEKDMVRGDGEELG
jgi:hypothetical protein